MHASIDDAPGGVTLRLAPHRTNAADGGGGVLARAWRGLVVVVVIGGATAAPSAAQGVRIHGASTSRYVQLRPLVADSVPESAASTSDGLDRLLNDGTLARCRGDGFCRYVRAAPVTQLMALMQDVDATAWGFGRGVSAHAELRFREAFGGGRSLWPQAQQHLDVLAAYAELDRERLRARLGRQWFASELGFRNFDGALVQAQPLRTLGSVRATVYAGRSLLQGLARDLTSDALATIEELPPDSRGLLFGGTLGWRPTGGRGTVRAQYEREIRQDRAGLYTERASAAANLRLGRARLSGELVYDFATSALNEARLRARHPISPGVDLSLEARHSTPFFPLWTIWGTFSPVGFDEGLVDARWSSPGSRFTVSGRGAYRRYQATDAGVASLPLRTDGWRLGSSVGARISRTWRFQGGYGVDVGSTASRSDADVAIRWLRSDRISLAARGAAFETISEWRVGTGRIWGAGADISIALRPDLQFAADAMIYRQRTSGRPTDGPWNQRRATMRLEWSIGSDPGLRANDGAR
ncbi:MAG: hypothetical protein IT360_19410 [Gemmatimonadaceae bacterium]|nr:hypothetical protein [Gemmatimonadaceae bacterium]